MSIPIARWAKHVNMQITVATVKNSSVTNKEIQLKGDPLYVHHISKGKFVVVLIISIFSGFWEIEVS